MKAENSQQKPLSRARHVVMPSLLAVLDEKSGFSIRAQELLKVTPQRLTPACSTDDDAEVYIYLGIGSVAKTVARLATNTAAKPVTTGRM
jgi:hypothetical protein